MPVLRLNAVSTALGIQVRSGKVKAEGDLDFRGTLGVAKDAPVGFREIRLAFELDTDADAEQLASLIKLTERYRVVLQTLRTPPNLRPYQAGGLEPARHAAPCCAHIYRHGKPSIHARRMGNAAHHP